MDRTDSRTIIQPPIGQPEAKVGQTGPAQLQEEELRGLAQRLLDAGQNLPALMRAALDGLIAFLGFERAFLVLSGGPEGRGGPAHAAEDDSPPLRVVAARARAWRSETDRGEDVPNPEFALNRSAVKRAFQSVQAFAIQDCLVQPHRDREEFHRSVLCLPFSAGPDMPAAVYLDRGLGGGPIEARDLARIAAFAERCLPILCQGLLHQEVLNLRAQLQSPSDPEGAHSEAASTEASGYFPGERAEGSRRPQPAEHGAEVAPADVPAQIPSYHGIVGRSEKLRRIFQVIEKIKDSDLNICIFGESGTGKELVARAIHWASLRRDRPFISENCGTIAENLLESELFGHMKGAFTGADEDRKGLFELASGGTLFLDEISDMSEGMQRKLLRVLQEGVIRPIGSKQTLKVDTRIVCASNKNLAALVQSGAFRVDLYYRVNVVSIEVPPLRDRRDDIPILAAHFCAELAAEGVPTPRVSESAMTSLREYSWPGNVRELRNVIRRAATTCSRGTLHRKDVLPLLADRQAAGSFSGEGLERTESQMVLHVPRRDGFNEIIGECERVVLFNALKECNWNKSKVVKMLKIPRQSLYNMIAKHDLRRKWEE